MKELFDAITVLKARSNPENWDDVLRVQRAADALQQQLAAAREELMTAEGLLQAVWRLAVKWRYDAELTRRDPEAFCNAKLDGYTETLDECAEEIAATLQRDRQP